MAPQPTAAPTVPAEPAPHAALLDDIRGKLNNNKPLSSVEKQIFRAETFEAERSEVMKRIAANREYLRLMDENDELGDDEQAWLDDFYPQKEKGSSRTEAEIERTRKAKQAARSRS